MHFGAPAAIDNTPALWLDRHSYRGSRPQAPPWNHNERRLRVFPLFDIFQLQQDNSLRWCEATDTLEAAHARILVLGKSAPGQYIIVNQQSGQKLVIDASGAKSAANS